MSLLCHCNRCHYKRCSLHNPISFQISDIDVLPGLSKIPPPSSSAVFLKKRATESAPPPSTSNENEDESQRLEIQESILKLELIMTNVTIIDM